MPDISLRFNQDMLVLSTPVEASLARQGVSVEENREFFSLIEAEILQDFYHLQQVAGVQCLVSNTAGITRARLRHHHLDERDEELALASLRILASMKPQHSLIEIGPCGLPLDPSSTTSLRQSRDEYARAASIFGIEGYDAFFLNDMRDTVDMKCALMGLRKVSDKPIFASLNLSGLEESLAASGEPNQGAVSLEASNDSFKKISDTLSAAFAMMEEYGADVLGFASSASLDQVLSYLEPCKQASDLPFLVQLDVRQESGKAFQSKEPYGHPDTMIEAAEQLRDAGVQFLRAVGEASPAYAGALALTVLGQDVRLETR